VTISATTRLAFLPFRSPAGPFPAGIWTSQQTVIGDASGGEAVIAHEVILLTEPFSAIMLTIEQIFLDSDRGVDVDVLLQAIGFEEHNPVGNNNILMSFLLEDLGASTVTALRPDGQLRKPIFLGRCDRTSGQNSEISFRWTNNDGTAFRDSVYGYYWGPEAMYVPGGPQRPPGSLFGN